MVVPGAENWFWPQKTTSVEPFFPPPKAFEGAAWGVWRHNCSSVIQTTPRDSPGTSKELLQHPCDSPATCKELFNIQDGRCGGYIEKDFQHSQPVLSQARLSHQTQRWLSFEFSSLSYSHHLHSPFSLDPLQKYEAQLLITYFQSQYCIKFKLK